VYGYLPEIHPHKITSDKYLIAAQTGGHFFVQES
jgi:hypothetical protein